VTSIGEAAFWYCSGLAVINYRGTEAEWNAITKAEWDGITKGSGWNANCPAVIVYDYED
jgi:hypothetical protein